VNRQYVSLKSLVITLIVTCLSLASLISATIAAQPETIEIYGNWPASGPDKAAYDTLQTYLRMYEEKNPHVRFEDLGREHSSSKVLNLLITGTAPGLIALGNTHVLRFAADGLLSEVPEHFAALMHENLFPAAVEGSTLFGKVVSVPTLNNISTLYYNRRVLAESGLSPVPPTTLSELEEAGIKTTRRAADGSVERIGLQLSTNWHESRFLQLLFWNHGAEFVDADGKLTVDTQPVRQMIDRLLEWNRTFLGRLSSSIFASGNAAFSHAASGFMESYRQRYPLDFYEDIGAGPTPAGPAGRVEYQFSNGYAVPRGPHEEEVWKFLEWLYFSNDGPGGMTPQGHIFLVRGVPPLHRGDVGAMLSSDPDLAPYYSAFVNNISVARNSDSYFVENGIDEGALHDLARNVYGGMAPEQAIEAMAANLRSFMAENSIRRR